MTLTTDQLYGQPRRWAITCCCEIVPTVPRAMFWDTSATLYITFLPSKELAGSRHSSNWQLVNATVASKNVLTAADTRARRW